MYAIKQMYFVGGHFRAVIAPIVTERTAFSAFVSGLRPDSPSANTNERKVTSTWGSTLIDVDAAVSL